MNLKKNAARCKQGFIIHLLWLDSIDVVVEYLPVSQFENHGERDPSSYHDSVHIYFFMKALSLSRFDSIANLFIDNNS